MTEHDREGEPAAQQAQENAAEATTETADGSGRAGKGDKEGEPAAEQARDSDAS